MILKVKDFILIYLIKNVVEKHTIILNNFFNDSLNYFLEL